MTGLAWSWRNVAFGGLLALPAAVLTLTDPAAGVPLAIGVLPAAALGVAGPRRARTAVVIVGAVGAASIVLGAAASPIPALAIAILFALCVVVASFAGDPRHRFVPVLMGMGLPLYGVGLSEGSVEHGLAAGTLIVAGSVYAWLLSLLWPPRGAPPRPPRAAVPRRTMTRYGVQIGLAGSTAATIGFLLGADHPGWGATSALIVSRPQRRQLNARAVGRAASVSVGALVACTFALASPPAPAFALLVVLILATATGLAGSRWYVFPFFSTVLVLTMLLFTDDRGPHWFIERIGLTLVGVASALVFTWLVPTLSRDPWTQR